MASQVQRRIDWFTLVAGIGTLLAAGYVLGDGPSWLPVLDLRWVLAAAAAVGLVLLASSLRGK